MKQRWRLTLVAFVFAATGLTLGTTLVSTQEQETNYMVIMDFGMGPDMTPNQGIEYLSEWVRIIRASGEFSSARLFMHEWGSNRIFFLLTETNDWNAIGSMSEDFFAQHPEFMDEPWMFSSHSDEILVEIPVQ